MRRSVFSVARRCRFEYLRRADYHQPQQWDRSQSTLERSLRNSVLEAATSVIKAAYGVSEDQGQLLKRRELIWQLKRLQQQFQSDKGERFWTS